MLISFFTLEPLQTEEINQLSPGQNILGTIDPFNNTSQFLQALQKKCESCFNGIYSSHHTRTKDGRFWAHKQILPDMQQ